MTQATYCRESASDRANPDTPSTCSIRWLSRHGLGYQPATRIAAVIWVSESTGTRQSHGSKSDTQIGTCDAASAVSVLKES